MEISSCSSSGALYPCQGVPRDPSVKRCSRGSPLPLASRDEGSRPALVLPTLAEFRGLRGPNWNRQLGGKPRALRGAGWEESERGWAEPGAPRAVRALSATGRGGRKRRSG